jgi:hypothetical protein
VLRLLLDPPAAAGHHLCASCRPALLPPPLLVLLMLLLLLDGPCVDRPAHLQLQHLSRQLRQPLLLQLQVRRAACWLLDLQRQQRRRLQLRVVVPCCSP